MMNNLSAADDPDVVPDALHARSDIPDAMRANQSGKHSRPDGTAATGILPPTLLTLFPTRVSASAELIHMQKSI